MPDRATVSTVTSSQNRLILSIILQSYFHSVHSAQNEIIFTSRHHPSEGHARKNRIGILDSSFTAAENRDTASVLDIRNVNENQK